MWKASGELQATNNFKVGFLVAQSFTTVNRWRLPVVACLHLKRFEQTATGSRSKVATPVSFPKTLDMGPFMSSARNTSLSPEFCDSAHYKYELFAVVNHMGNLQSGHYTSFIRQTSSWFRCDDSLITKASIEQVLNSEAYLLFYHKKSIRFWWKNKAEKIHSK